MPDVTCKDCKYFPIQLTGVKHGERWYCPELDCLAWGLSVCTRFRPTVESIQCHRCSGFCADVGSGKVMRVHGIGYCEECAEKIFGKNIKDEYAKKSTNPKDACGIKKVPTWFIPTGPMLEVGLAFMEGARKYGAFNWRKEGVRASVYYDAIQRHLSAFKEGEDVDPDSGVHHLDKAIACLLVLRDSMLMGNWTDDRPIRYPNGLDIKGMNKQAEGLIEKYPECAKPFLETDKDEHS